MDVGQGGSVGVQPPSGLESTVVLLSRVRAGDGRAVDILFRRYEPVLRTWAHGRLPGYARDLSSTDDIVQKTLVAALRGLKGFVPRRDGAFLAWLSTILRNQVRDEQRRAMRRPPNVEIPENHSDPGPSPIQKLIGAERLEQYEAAVQRLPPGARSAVILWVEFGFGYTEIAAELELDSVYAAHKRVRRGLKRLAELMGVGLDGS
jgi:RNA polymerase sigma-70 factor, ECF subfamily